MFFFFRKLFIYPFLSLLHGLFWLASRALNLSGGGSLQQQALLVNYNHIMYHT